MNNCCCINFFSGCQNGINVLIIVFIAVSVLSAILLILRKSKIITNIRKFKNENGLGKISNDRDAACSKEEKSILRDFDEFK